MSTSKSQAQSVVIQIVIAIIASSIIVTIFSTFYNDYLKKPYIKTMDVSQLNNTHYNIRLTNIGLQPANRTKITITSPLPILYPNSTVFSTDYISQTKSQGKYDIALYLPRFVQGNGSLISITIAVNLSSAPTICKPQRECDNVKNKLVVYSTYDQGSNTSKQQPDFIRESLFLISTQIT